MRGHDMEAKESGLKLVRDNKRFAFWPKGGLPKVPEDATGELTVIYSFVRSEGENASAPL